MVSKEDFLAYEKVRASGITNMFDTERVQRFSGLTEDTIFEVMDNYDELWKQYLANPSEKSE